ncbi:hypothetical protein [Aliidiomarina indica]|uniref:hypothetical protein n=1 Tax=Aliidiomarina indica TaxID=2749147 RepID=UPI00188E7DD3|nr:hypothetical protein [Aliidiomarina indica]
MQRFGSVGMQTIAVVGVIALLLALSLGQAYVYLNAIGLLFILSLFAVFAFAYVNDIRLLRRHALLAYVFSSTSKTKRLLWDGFFTQLIHAILGWGIALSAFILTLRLTLFEWAAFVLTVPLFVFIFRRLRQRVGKELHERFQITLVSRAALWLTVLCSAAILSLLQVFFLDVADTRHLQYSQIALQHWQARPDTALPWLGYLVAALDVIYASLWHSLQVASSLPTGLNAGGLFAIWLAFLILNGLQIGLIFTLIMGLLALFNRAHHMHGAKALMGACKPGIVIGVLGPALLLCVLLNVAQRPALWSAADPVSDETVALDPCQMPSVRREVDTLEEAAEARLSEYAIGLETAIERRLRVGLQHAFMQAEPAVDRFLDWNYSIRGQYQQLALLAAASVSEQVFADALAQRLEKDLAEFLEPALLTLNEQVDAEVALALQGLLAQQQGWLAQAQSHIRCEIATIDLTPIREQLNQSGVGAGAVGGVLVWRLAAGAGTRAASRTGVRRAFAGLFSRAGTRVAAASGSAAAGSFCGPMAWLCVPVLVGGSWLAVDYTMVEIDERMHRDTMRAAILDSLNEEQERIYQGLRQHYQQELDAVLALISRQQGEQFNIWRDGLGREAKDTRPKNDRR